MDEESNQIKELQNQIALYEDMRAYQRLYELLFDGLYRFCNAFVKSGPVAEEIVSDVFIKVWQLRSRLPEINNLKVYCYTITRNFSYNYLLRQNKHVTLDLDALAPETLIATGDPETLCISADLMEKIREAVRQLPPQCQLIFQLIREEGLRYKEVAEILHLSPLTVRNQLAIATRKIAALLPAGVLSAGLKKFSDS